MLALTRNPARRLDGRRPRSVALRVFADRLLITHAVAARHKLVLIVKGAHQSLHSRNVPRRRGPIAGSPCEAKPWRRHMPKSKDQALLLPKAPS